MRDYAYYKKALAGIPMPFAFVDLDLLEQNRQAILARSNGKNIRLASKSIRSIALLRSILDSSDQFQGIMCFTAREAIDLSKQGFSDLLLGYPVFDPKYLREIAIATKDGASITLMVDSMEHIEQIERIARDVGVRLPVCVDIDLSYDFFGLHFGVYRSPIHTMDDLLTVVKRIHASDAIYLDGLMGYEAQIAGVGDQVPSQKAKSALIRWLKKRSTKQLRKKRAEAIAAIQQLNGGPPLRFINGGGTGSLHSTSLEDCVTEVTVGSGFFSPTLFDHYRDFRYQPAAGFAIEIVRIPRSGIYTCAGGGYIASGSIGIDKQPSPYLPQGAKLLPLEGAGEVQTPIRYDGKITLQHGDPIFMRHSKSGELCERFDKLYCIKDGKIVDIVSTYRGDGKCYL